MSAPPDRRKWTRWIERITNEMSGSEVDREVFRQWWDIVQDNPRLDMNNRFTVFIWSAYLDSQTLFVRRQVKYDKQAISLVGLLHEIADHSSDLTRDAFLKRYTKPKYKDAWREGQRLFNSFAGRGKDHVSARRVHADIDRLTRLSRAFMTHADKWLAHSDQRRRWPRISVRKLDRVLDALYREWRRYHPLVRGGPIHSDPRFLAEQNWQRVFDFPWRVPTPPAIRES